MDLCGFATNEANSAQRRVATLNRRLAMAKAALQYADGEASGNEDEEEDDYEGNVYEENHALVPHVNEENHELVPCWQRGEPRAGAAEMGPPEKIIIVSTIVKIKPAPTLLDRI